MEADVGDPSVAVSVNVQTVRHVELVSPPLTNRRAIGLIEDDDRVYFDDTVGNLLESEAAFKRATKKIERERERENERKEEKRNESPFQSLPHLSSSPDHRQVEEEKETSSPM